MNKNKTIVLSLVLSILIGSIIWTSVVTSQGTIRGGDFSCNLGKTNKDMLTSIGIVSPEVSVVNCVGGDCYVYLYQNGTDYKKILPMPKIENDYAQTDYRNNLACDKLKEYAQYKLAEKVKGITGGKIELQ